MKKSLLFLLTLLIFSCEKENDEIVEVNAVKPSFGFASTAEFQVYPSNCGNYIIPNSDSRTYSFDVNDDGLDDFKLFVKVLYHNAVSPFGEPFVRKHTEIAIEALQEKSFTSVRKSNEATDHFFDFNEEVNYDADWNVRSIIYTHQNFDSQLNSSFESLEGINYVGLLMNSSSETPNFGWLSFKTENCNFQLLEYGFKLKGSKSILAGQN